MKVDIDGETYYLRKFTVKEYFAANIKPDDQYGAMVGMIAISLANEDGSTKYPVLSDARTAVDAMPFSTALALSTAVTELNGLAEKKPN